MTSRHDRRAFNAETVRMVRTALRLTQGDFARMMGVSRRTIIRWERGTHYPPTWHHKGKGIQRRRKFFRLWDKYEGWVNHVNQRGRDAA